MKFRRRPPPEPPQNVQVELHDGRRIPVECSYRGWRNGSHEWVATAPLGVPFFEIAAITMDMLPAKTSVGIESQAARLEGGR